MKVERSVLLQLNKVLGQYLISINQYFLHARILKNWGFEGLGHPVYKKSIQDMKESDDLIERILLLEGLPNLQELGKLLIGEDVPEILKCDLDREYQKRAVLVEAIAHLEEVQDYVSRELLEGLLDESEEYIDWLETERENIEVLGLEIYLQQLIEKK
ncbi:putative bacterioferritin B [Ignatzschineria indica]|uniref:Bacterioferritin n=2 Tax=Ignatzschineria TaxID=112008 RepID=A0ABX5L119_9GAMM|nr:MULTISPECIES: bacterioferritin [Ignatzschineria]MDM1544664.1 bacterioferritin [Ignatzschineria indica]OYQ81828.1 bacterioferritin [Ignatzschineria sp. F8392]PWD84405.1 bacterioferritin [Ignatzschineria indica]PWD90473.1 bacterioferritin [Ignatzschineria cameli]PWD92357.1 bacterioferritin [Ignatzschineria cameli]